MNNQKDNIMLKKCIVCGAFAAVVAFLTVIAVSGCNEDEEYSENGNYTLAKKRVTRSAETVVAARTDTIYESYSFSFDEKRPLSSGVHVDVSVDVMICWVRSKPVAEMLSYAIKESNDPLFRVTGVHFEKDLLLKRYVLYASGVDGTGTGCSSRLDGVVF